MASGRFRELMKKYGKVALGVHFSVSAASITGLYVAIKNNVDVESLLDKVHMGRFMNNKGQEQPHTDPSQNPAEIPSHGDGFVLDEAPSSEITQSTAAAAAAAAEKKRNRTAELAASSGGALALAVLVNKALFPIRVPITIAATPPIARFLARRKIMKTGV